QVESARHTIVQSSLGFKAQHALATPYGLAQLQGEVAWHHTSGDLRAYSQQRLRHSTKQTLFTSEGQPLARHAWSLRLGVEANLGKHSSLGFAYAGQYAPGQQDHGARVNIRWAF